MDEMRSLFVPTLAFVLIYSNSRKSLPPITASCYGNGNVMYTEILRDEG